MAAPSARLPRGGGPPARSSRPPPRPAPRCRRGPRVFQVAPEKEKKKRKRSRPVLPGGGAELATQKWRKTLDPPARKTLDPLRRAGASGEPCPRVTRTRPGRGQYQCIPANTNVFRPEHTHLPALPALP